VSEKLYHNHFCKRVGYFAKKVALEGRRKQSRGVISMEKERKVGVG